MQRLNGVKTPFETRFNFDAHRTQINHDACSMQLPCNANATETFWLLLYCFIAITCSGNNHNVKSGLAF